MPTASGDFRRPDRSLSDIEPERKKTKPIVVRRSALLPVMSGFHSLDAPLSLTGDDSMQELLCLWS
jgi:hypothetical protein